MSYADYARGGARELAELQSQATQEAERLLFQMATSIAQLKKLVDGLGTPRDTIDHRHRISEQNSKIQGLAKDIKEKVTKATEDRAVATPQLQAKSRKLLQDFANMLQDYKTTQKAAAEKEASCLPRTPPQKSLAVPLEVPGVEVVIEQQAAQRQQEQEQVRLLDNAISYNEALIEERDEGIAVIQRQIGEVNEMFQDLAVLINDQGMQINTVDQQIGVTADRAREGRQQLVQAHRSQRAARNKCLVLWLISAVIVSIVIIVLFS